MIISIINQKGGVGKSTTALSLSVGLSLRNKKVLAIDMDGQANLTFTLKKKQYEYSLMDILKKDKNIVDVMEQVNDNLYLVPADMSLTGADMQLTEVGKEYRLKEALEPLKEKFEYIVIDTPPALGILTVNALTASDTIIVPAQADIYSLDAIGRLYNTIKTIRQYTNPTLDIAGILLTRYSNRAILSREIKDMSETTADALNTRLFKSTIRDAIAIKEAQANDLDIFTYAPKSNVAHDYELFIEEFLELKEV